MGLGAEQARLLTITARKSDCEFQSMNLSHQKIALSRDMEKVSTNYQNALEATKLVYDYYGSGTSEMDLTYGLLMTPSAYNDYYPKLVTDSKNRVVLNSSYAAAARAAGIPAEGLSGTPSSDVRNKFIEALAGENIITPNKAATIQSVTYGNTIGVGSTSNVTTGTTEITYDELIDMITANCEDSASWGLTMGTSADKAQYDGGYERFCVAPDGNGIQQGGSSQSVSLADLLNDKAQYNLSLESKRGEKTPIYETAYLQEKIIGSGENSTSFLNWMVEQFSTVLGGTNASDAALQAAYNAVYDLIYPDSSIQKTAEELYRGGNDQNGKALCEFTEYDDRLAWDNGAKTLREHMQTVGTKLGHDVDGKYDDYNPDVVNQASNYLGFVFTDGYDGNRWFHPDRNDHTTVAINLNNIADVFLTSYVEAMKGVENSDYTMNVGNKSNSNMYDPNTDDFKFTIPVDTDVDTGDTCLEASFYDTLFNRICLDGWTENDRINDSDYMQEMMKSGLIYISSISDDGYYYQGNYSTDKNISEVPDEEAISKAEAQYNTEKTKIENKEQKIDMKMKNLDTEISSLTTEYDTTKSVISKNIEKSFKRYEA